MFELLIGKTHFNQVLKIINEEMNLNIQIVANNKNFTKNNSSTAKNISSVAKENDTVAKK